jgi:SNF2 family DNA or RNA helicase
MLTLRPYQSEDVQKLQTKYAFGIFSQQRTGKTPTSLVACDMWGAKRILIVCPASMLYNWADEFEDWLGRPCLVYDGQKGDDWIDEWTDGLAISYGALKTTTAYTGQAALIKSLTPEAIIVDEAHRIKGRTTKVARAINQFKNVPYKLALTGTPAPNKIYDVWAILHFLYPKHFSSYWNFIYEYFKTKSMRSDGGNKFTIPQNIKPEMEPILTRKLSYITIQHKRKDVMDWLPDEPTPKKIRLPLNTLQKRYIDELSKWYETEHIIVHGELDRLMRYRQICLAPELLELEGGSPKLDWIKQYLADYPDKPILIFTKFTTWINIIKREIPEVGVFSGQVSKKARQILKQDFQSGKINTLVIQIDAGKEGITLDRAECVIFTDVFPPAADIEQAKDRFVPTTRDKADIPKEIITLAMRDSYDEEIYNLVNRNLSITEIVNDYKKYI